MIDYKDTCEYFDFVPCCQILKALLANQPLPKLFAQQLAWQEAFTQLLVTSPKNHFMTSQYSNMTLQDSDLDSANHNTPDKSFSGYYSNGGIGGVMDAADTAAVDGSLQVLSLVSTGARCR